jgi:hypothetical protein
LYIKKPPAFPLAAFILMNRLDLLLLLCCSFKRQGHIA